MIGAIATGPPLDCVRILAGAGMTGNVVWQNGRPRETRRAPLGQRPVIASLTGLSGAAKTGSFA
ncbi:hypothetical protein [Methylobacterium sp. J-068]|uniref:hypothetical protein n=1 Tax=Methylobacterium sp. J-068 TaxID=2836649 RepID=UPI001FB99FC9|nr:hypothetical protein [Methylobacterium sp. J-068]MCJ2036341.1 hypothetical protein [Methylobacterium sp. J-068]